MLLVVTQHRKQRLDFQQESCTV